MEGNQRKPESSAGRGVRPVGFRQRLVEKKWDAVECVPTIGGVATSASWRWRFGLNRQAEEPEPAEMPALPVGTEKQEFETQHNCAHSCKFLNTNMNRGVLRKIRIGNWACFFIIASLPSVVSHLGELAVARWGLIGQVKEPEPGETPALPGKMIIADSLELSRRAKSGKLGFLRLPDVREFAGWTQRH